MFRICEVLSVEDTSDGQRIKVRLKPEDNYKESLEEIDYVHPFLPKMIHIKPKVGEAGIVFTADDNDANSVRYYVGPIISQLHHLEKEPYYLDATSLYDDSYITPDKAPSLNPETKGAYMKDDDIGLYGRKNVELVLRDNDARLQSGVRVASTENKRDVIFNTKTPAYLKLAHYDTTQEVDGQEYGSTATIVADKINLISNNSEFKTTDRDDLITEEEMQKIIEKAHQLPYGDVLVEFLTLFKNAFLKHVHPFPTLPPCVDDTVLKVAGYNLDKILSDDIRIS